MLSSRDLSLGSEMLQIVLAPSALGLADRVCASTLLRARHRSFAVTALEVLNANEDMLDAAPRGLFAVLGLGEPVGIVLPDPAL